MLASTMCASPPCSNGMLRAATAAKPKAAKAAAKPKESGAQCKSRPSSPAQCSAALCERYSTMSHAWGQ